MALIGRLAGHPDRHEGDHGRDEIQAGVGRLGQDAQAAAQQPHHDLQTRQQGCRAH